MNVREYEYFKKQELSKLSYFGLKKYKKLTGAKVNTIKELINSDVQELHQKSGIPLRTIEKLKKNAEAIKDNKIIQIRPFTLPLDVIYFDIETDLLQSYIWMIGAHYKNRFYPFYSDSRKNDKDILQKFLNFINNHPDTMLCYYSPKGFDRRLLITSFNESALKVEDFTKRKFLDLAIEIKSRFYLPTTFGLKDVSKLLNYHFKYSDMDGLAAAYLYEKDAIKNKNKLIAYNKDDLLSMKHIINVLNKNTIGNIKKEFEEHMFSEDIAGPIDENKILDLKNKGYTLQQIADLIGRSPTYIYARINKKYAPSYLAEKTPKEVCAKPPKSKNVGDELLIKELRKRNYKLNEIAKMLNKSVYYINSRLNEKYEPSYLKEKEPKRLPIGISWLNSMGFCEQWVFLRHHKKLDLPLSKEMKEGSKIHEDKEIEFLNNAVPTTKKMFIESEKPVFNRETTVGMLFGDVALIGKIDRIEVDKNGVYVVEEKPNPKLYAGIKNQVLAYSVVLKNYINDILKKPVHAVLRDRDSEKNLWKKKIDDCDERDVFKAVIRTRNILKGETPTPTKNINKCKKCGFKTICEFSLVKNTK